MKSGRLDVAVLLEKFERAFQDNEYLTPPICSFVNTQVSPSKQNKKTGIKVMILF